MKVARFILKIIAASLALVAVVCCVIAYWDKIAGFFRRLGQRMDVKCCCGPSEYDDYADLEE